MPDMLTMLTPGMTKLSKDMEDVLEVRLLVIVYHVVHLVNLKPVTGRLLMLIMTDGPFQLGDLSFLSTAAARSLVM